MDKLEAFYNSISYSRKWAVCALIYYSYGIHGTRVLYPVNDVDFLIWEEAITALILSNWKNPPVISSEMSSVIQAGLSLNYPKSEFESYALCKIFLDCMHEENTRNIVLYCRRFENLSHFLSGVHDLYQQKYSVSQLKILFARILYPDIFKKIPLKDARDVLNIIIRKLEGVPLVLTTKKALTYKSFIQDFTPLTEFSLAKAFIGGFTTDTILPAREFKDLCHLFNDASKASTTKDIVTQNIVVTDMLNMLNKLYGNIAFIALFGYKEEGITHHRDLYTNLTEILNRCLT